MPMWFTGTIPDIFFGSSYLVTIDMDGNALIGVLSTEVGTITQLIFVPSNLCMASPNNEDQCWDMAVLNFLASRMMEALIWFNLVSALTHVDRGSQQFDNLGQYVIIATASVKIVVYLALSCIVMGFTLPVRS
jgi:hypothetical protein